MPKIMNHKFITSKIDALSKEFRLTLDVNLWENVPYEQVGNITDNVTTKDEFIAKIISLTAIFDSFNKNEFYRKSGIKTHGTRISFITFLKKEFKNKHFEIQNEIEEPIGMICLLRDYIAHGKNKNYKKAFEYFEEKHPVDNWGNLWSTVLSTFGQILDSTLLILKEKDLNTLKSSEINEELQEILKAEILHEVVSNIESDQCKAMLREIACRDQIVDTELASIFNIDVEKVRLYLFPFLRNILVVRPNDEKSTKLQIV